jgi:hypothetical protein
VHTGDGGRGRGARCSEVWRCSEVGDVVAA